MHSLVIERDSGYADRARKYKIYCNSKEIGKIGNGESASFELPVGRHEVHFRIDWARSNKIVIDARDDETSMITVGSSLRGWRLALAALYIVFMPHKYLWARLQNAG